MSWKVFCEDNKKTLEGIGSVDYIITSPPYNIAGHRNDCYYDIGYEDGLGESEYLDVRVREFELFESVLNPLGCICYNLGYSYKNPSLPSKLVVEVEKQTGFSLADKITWKKKTAIPFQTSKQRLSRICEQIYVFALNPNEFETNKTVSKVNEDTGQSFYQNYTNYVEARNNDGVETDLKATYSSELVRKLIDIYVAGGTVYDPFMGVGTTGVACASRGLRFVGSEINAEHFEIAKQRIAAAYQKTSFFEYE